MALMPRNPIYKVRKGECLWTIARDQYGDPEAWQEIARSNGLRPPYTILVGQTLRLPLIASGSSSGARPGGAVRLPNAPHNLRISSPAAESSGPSPTVPPLDASRLARPVAYPAFKYNLQNVPKVEIITPQVRYSLQLKGEISLQKKGALSEVEFSNQAMTTKLKTDSDSELSKLTSAAEIKAPWGGNSAELKCELAVAAKVQGQVFATQKVAMIPPSTFRYTYEPAPISGQHGEFVFKGTFGYQLDLTPQGQTPLPQPVRVPVPESLPKWVAVGLLIAAGALVVGTLAEDVITGGAGALDDPISFGAAAAMTGRALTAF
jgi:hypothetical protein